MLPLNIERSQKEIIEQAKLEKIERTRQLVRAIEFQKTGITRKTKMTEEGINALQSLAYMRTGVEAISALREEDALAKLSQALTVADKNQLDVVLQYLIHLTNSTEGSLFCFPLHKKVMTVLKKNTHAAVSVLTNIVQFCEDDNMLEEMRQSKVAEGLADVMQNGSPETGSVFAAFGVSILVGHIEDHPLLKANEKLIKQSVDALDSFMKGFSYFGLIGDVWEVLIGLANLSVNDTNKRFLIQAGAAEKTFHIIRTHLERLKASGDDQKKNRASNPKTCKYGMKLISNLAFAQDLNLLVGDAMTVLKEFLNVAGDEREAKTYASMALFQLRLRQNPDTLKKKILESEEKVMEEDAEEEQPHIMLSYPWKHQKFILWLKEFLEANGFKVWMDLHEMTASLLESMAHAVESSSAVIVCVCDEYKQSEACRTEAEYAYSLKKPIIPIKLDNYMPKGWLAALVANKLYFKFTHEDVNTGHNVIGEINRLLHLKEELSAGAVRERGVSVSVHGNRRGSILTRDAEDSTTMAVTVNESEEVVAAMQQLNDKMDLMLNKMSSFESEVLQRLKKLEDAVADMEQRTNC